VDPACSMPFFYSSPTIETGSTDWRRLPGFGPYSNVLVISVQVGAASLLVSPSHSSSSFSLLSVCFSLCFCVTLRVCLSLSDLSISLTFSVSLSPSLSLLHVFLSNHLTLDKMSFFHELKKHSPTGLLGGCPVR
jgi:hypothetical protein